MERGESSSPARWWRLKLYKMSTHFDPNSGDRTFYPRSNPPLIEHNESYQYPASDATQENVTIYEAPKVDEVISS